MQERSVTRLEERQVGAAVAPGDVHGELLAFLRTDGCRLSCIAFAINKAYAAAREQAPSKKLGDEARERGFPVTKEECCAAAVHERSGRPGPFVAVICALYGQTNAAAELFATGKAPSPGAGEASVGHVRSDVARLDAGRWCSSLPVR